CARRGGFSQARPRSLADPSRLARRGRGSRPGCGCARVWKTKEAEERLDFPRGASRWPPRSPSVESSPTPVLRSVEIYRALRPKRDFQCARAETVRRLPPIEGEGRRKDSAERVGFDGGGAQGQVGEKDAGGLPDGEGGAEGRVGDEIAIPPLGFEKEASDQRTLAGGHIKARVENRDLHLVTKDLDLSGPASPGCGDLRAGGALDLAGKKLVYPRLERGAAGGKARAEESRDETAKSRAHGRLRHPPARPKDRPRRAKEPTPRMGAAGRLRGRGRITRRRGDPGGKGGDRSRRASGRAVPYLRRPRSGSPPA